MTSHLVEELAANRRAMATALLMSLVVLAPYLLAFDAASAPVVRWAYLSLAAGLCLLALMSRAAFVAVCTLLAPATLIHLHIKRHWGAGQLSSRFEASYESPTGETIEYLSSHVDRVDVALLLALAVYLIFLFRLTSRHRVRSVTVRRAAAAALVVWALASVAFHAPRGYLALPPLQVVVQAVEARQRFDLLAQRRENLERAPLRARDCHLRYDKIVVVLGESAISDHMSIFGYPKATTPFAVASHPYAFDALAPANQTRYSLAMMLTDARPGDFDSFFASHSLVGQLGSCGMRTLWISNQGRRGRYDSFSTSLAMEAQEQVFLNEWSWNNSQLDGRIVDELEARGEFGNHNQATFIHLIGSHTDYGQRYPAGFGFPDTGDKVAEYDNSILYTDHVLSRLYRGFAGGSLLFVYVSDHGQIVSNARFGSGFLPGYKEEYRTPFLVWTDDTSAIETLRLAIGHSRLNMESLDDVVRFLAGISTTPNISTRQTVSILTPEIVKQYDELESLPAD
jgi:glucan phosphoethanolaminetransferase (alkaline phosphatase superfamily)